MIVVDRREPRRYAQELRKRGVAVHVMALDVGDFRVVRPGRPAVCVERKTAADFASSILDGRLWRQALALTSCGVGIVLVEGSLSKALVHSGLERRHVAGALARLTSVGLLLVSVPGWRWTVDYLASLDEKLEDAALTIKVDVGKEGVDGSDWEKRAALMGAVVAVPGFGRKTAVKVAREYGSIAELVEDSGRRLVGILSPARLRRLLRALGLQNGQEKRRG